MKEEKAVVAASAGQPCRAGGHNVSPVPVWGAAQTIVQRGGGAREVVALLRWVGLSTLGFTEFAQNLRRLEGGTCWPHVSVLAQTLSFL